MRRSTPVFVNAIKPVFVRLDRATVRVLLVVPLIGRRRGRTIVRKRETEGERERGGGETMATRFGWSALCICPLIANYYSSRLPSWR